MQRCPFCKGEVSEDLLRFGGHCPHCLNDIPGEEAATDPGAQARLRQEQESKAAAARLQRRNRLLAVVAFLVVGAGIGAWEMLREKPVPLVLDDTDFYIAPASAHRNAAVEAAEAEKARAEAEKVERERREAAARARATASAGGAASGTLDDAGPAPASPTGTSPAPESSAGRVGSLGASGLLPTGPSARAGIQGMVAKGDSEIKAMVKTVLESKSRQLQQCYETRLKENPGLKGRWTLSFVIEKDGKVSEAEANGEGVRDRPLEECMVRNAKGWQFQAVSYSVEMARTFVFSN